MTPREHARRIAILELHAIPDTPGLRRGHVLKIEGKPDRFTQIPALSAAFIAYTRGERRSLIREER